MNTKIIGLLMLVMLFATPALATITVTWATPSEGATYNNNPMNAAYVDLNFVVTDTNGAAIQSHLLEVNVYDRYWNVVQTLVSDVNVRTLTGATPTNCSPVASTGALSTYSCAVLWDMPENDGMVDGPY